jgi:DNA polymerase III epsilon subunit-like protein
MILDDSAAGEMGQAERAETLVSVDVETAGPTPGQYSLLSIGACLVDDPDRSFYIELKPVNDAADPHALAITGLSLEHLAETGVEPAQAMREFEEWVVREVPAGTMPVFTAFNAPFDWMFVHDYFQRYLGRNPFGHAALDMKAYYMGMTGVSWARTSMRHLAPRYLAGKGLSHNALDDARDQARLFRAVLAERNAHR